MRSPMRTSANEELGTLAVNNPLRTAPAVVVEVASPAPVVELVAPAPVVTIAEQSLVDECNAPGLALTYAALALVAEHIAPAPTEFCSCACLDLVNASPRGRIAFPQRPTQNAAVCRRVCAPGGDTSINRLLNGAPKAHVSSGTC